PAPRSAAPRPGTPTQGAAPPSAPGSLPRALEEAALSGVLNLSARKMKEFPRTAANHDLADTVEAGGSGPRNPTQKSASGLGYF
uniref:Uncharacterized protein n=1 Tax=Periophthalmus magnuspinnatus TaxID=409849 RepID=A0A3B3ZHV6_9GOBI